MKWQLIVEILSLILLPLGVIGTADAQDKITLGRTEKVILLPWGVKLPARIDSGAGVCALDARELQIDRTWQNLSCPTRMEGCDCACP